MSKKSRFVTLAAYSHGKAITLENFKIMERPVPQIAAGQLLLEPVVLGIEPASRGLMNGEDNWFLPQIKLGDPIRGFCVARVAASQYEGFAPGDHVMGYMEWADHTIWDSRGPQNILTVLTPVHPGIKDLSHALGIFGVTGITAYVGIMEIAKPKAGEVVLISSAAGGVGSVAGQIARILGAKVIGLTSTQEKREMLVNGLGFDAALDYRAPSLMEELRELAPNGPDVYFDNVGGTLSQTIMNAMRYPARVVECGQIATYDDHGGGWMMDLRPIHMNGLQLTSVMPTFFMEQMPSMISQLIQWVDEGKIKTIETAYHGLEHASTAMVDLMNGKGSGKLVVEL